MTKEKRQDHWLGGFARMLMSARRRRNLRQLCIRAGFHDIPYDLLARIFIVTLAMSVVWYAYFVYAIGIWEMGWLFILASFIMLIVAFEIILAFLALILFRFYIEVKIFNRVQRIEQELPLFLREFSTNLKAGREFVDALEDSLTPEFGPLYEDISAVAIEIRSGKMIEQVIRDYTLRYDSYTINESFEIILDSYKGGGGLSEIIDKIAGNLEVIHYLKKSAIASVSNYVVFMTIVSLIIAPLLFALSHNLLWLVQRLLEQAFAQGSSSYMGSIIQPLHVSFSDFKLFSRIGVAIISGSAAAIIGIIRRGHIKGASVLVLVYVSIALLVHSLSLVVLEELFKELYFR